MEVEVIMDEYHPVSATRKRSRHPLVTPMGSEDSVVAEQVEQIDVENHPEQSLPTPDSTFPKSRKKQKTAFEGMDQTPTKFRPAKEEVEEMQVTLADERAAWVKGTTCIHGADRCRL
jgi:hypothetical protein